MKNNTVSKSGLSKEEINDRADVIRHKAIQYVQDNPDVTLREISAHVGLGVPSIWNHSKVLVHLGCLEKYRLGSDTFYRATGVPYTAKRKKPAHKFMEAKQTIKNPHAREIRLLDRKPHEISKEEHEASRRRYLRSAFTSSSMGMFDGF